MQQVEKSNQDLELQLKRKRQQVRVLDALIIERTAYQREQEQIINNLIEAGNIQLMGLNHDIVMAKAMLKELKTDIRTTQQDKRLLEEDYQSLQVRVMTIDGPGFNMGIVQAG